jgi:hypothetical protein
MEMQSNKFARNMMAQKLMSENKDNPFNSRFFQPSDAMAAPQSQGFRNLMSRMETRDKQGTGANLYAGGAIASGFTPGAGVSDVLGYAPDPFNPGQTLPSFSENIDQGRYLDAGLQTVGAGGDVMLAASPFMPLLLAPAAAMKMTSQIGKALRGGSKATKTVDNAGEVAKVVPPTDKADGIFAFHGSAANFDEFKLSKIGTGEGHQAFGYGLYFTDSKDIAKFYKDALSKEVNVDGKPFIRGSKHYPEILKNEPLSTNLSATNGDLEKAIKNIEDTLNEMKELKNVDAIKSYTQELKDLKALRGKVEVRQNTGKTYEVNIKTVTDDLLDYDKPLSEQPKILAKLEKHYGARDLDVLSLKNKGKDSEKLTGREFYSLLQNKLGKDSMDKVVKINEKLSELNKVVDANSYGYRNFTSPVGEKAAKEYDKLLSERDKIPRYRFDDKSSELLNKLGIKGIKYEPGQLTPDGQYKTKGESNFVIFDDKIIDVMAKYGIVGAIGVSAMQGASGGTEGDILPPGAI